MTLERLRELARNAEGEAHAVYLASKDRRVPWYAKFLAACVLAYLFSPIDLIPDFIPVIGYLDDLIIVSAGLWLVVRLIPPDVMAEHRATARLSTFTRKSNWVVAVLIVGVWAAMLTVAGWLIARWVGRVR